MNTHDKGLWKGQAFAISQPDQSAFESQGLRSFFEYRDLGIDAATRGQYGANVIRAVPGEISEAHWHIHDLDFQLVYVTQGWVVFEYESATGGDSRQHTLREGSCVLQPPGIRHREVRHSDDLELIEITSPAEFETRLVDAPPN